MVEIRFLAHFPVDHLAHPVVSRLVLLLCQFSCIRLLCDWSFHLCHCIVYICYFCWVLCILGLIWLVLMALFFAAIRRDSVSHLKFSFLSHVQILSPEMFFIRRLKRPYSCFPSHFCFLVFVILLSIALSVLFLIAVNSPLSWFSM